jgi:hypothetical protein
MGGARPARLAGFQECDSDGHGLFRRSGDGPDERDYDNWLTTLTQASVRLDQLQKVVGELRQLCEKDDVVQSRQVLEVLKRHGTITKPDARSDAA